MSGKECIFRNYLTTCSVDKILADKDLTEIRKKKLVESSEQRKDDLHLNINDLSQAYHSLCYSTYTSKEKIERITNKRKAEQSAKEDKPTKSRR